MAYRPTNSPAPTRQGAEVFIGIGSNLGRRHEMFLRALTQIRRIPRIRLVALSPLYYTDPVGGAGPAEFLNGVARLNTSLEPLELLAYLEKIEKSMGRMTKGDYRPRTIDLDILVYGDAVVSERDLRIPDPDVRTRPFIAVPLLELAPSLVLADTG